MTKTVIEKITSSSSEVTVFKVVGTLGYHENKTLQKFFSECEKRRITRIVLDFSSLSSLGGGCAKIIKQVSSSSETSLSIAGASKSVLKFLETKADEGNLVLAETVEEAVEKLKAIPPTTYSEINNVEEIRHTTGESLPESLDEVGESCLQDQGAGGGVEENHDREDLAGERSPLKGQTRNDDIPNVIILGQGEVDEDCKEQPPPQEEKSISVERCLEGAAEGDSKESALKEKELKRKLFHYNTLLTISSDFNRISDRSSLIEVFLLTTIAQIGVESAAFFEEQGDSFKHAASKGFDGGEVRWPQISKGCVSIDMWVKSGGEFAIADLGFEGELKDKLRSCSVEYAAPFIIQEKLRGIVFLGKPIKRQLEKDWMDFLKILMNQAAISYEKSRRLEEESERTLGLVQTLISLIEENTMGKGNTDLVAAYTYAVANRMNYPKEYLKDLMFGAVLRDIGMIKVSDLIVRSPRELVQEEWEIIKRHPSDGAEMLRTMKFSEHTTAIVLCHHERFNGEGYPAGLEGSSIPLGAKIVSVVESYAAMLRDRPSRPALREEEALNTLKENWGMRYDPDVVKNFLAVKEGEMRSGEKIKSSHSELFKV